MLAAVVAATLLVGAPSGWQAWVAASKVPTSPVSVVVQDNPCYCFLPDPQNPTIQIAFVDRAYYGPYAGDTFTLDRVALMHELGHVFDLFVLTDSGRAAFENLAGDHRPWWQFPNPPAEKFAQAYEFCALYGDAQPGRWRAKQIVWGWNPVRRTQAAVCRLIRTAAAR